MTCGIKVFENHSYYENIIKQNKISKDNILLLNKKNYINKIKIYPSDCNFKFLLKHLIFMEIQYYNIMYFL